MKSEKRLLVAFGRLGWLAADWDGGVRIWRARWIWGIEWIESSFWSFFWVGGSRCSRAAAVTERVLPLAGAGRRRLTGLGS